MIQPADGTLMAEFGPPPTSQTDNASVNADAFHSALSDARQAETANSSNQKLASDRLMQARTRASGSSSPAESELAATPANTSTSVPAADSDPMPSLPVPPAATSATTAAAVPAATSSTTDLDAQQAFDNAYWAAQPAAVQALRTVQDPSERATLAAQLAGEGYQIDVPIMVWGWDPSITTSMRESLGYTWVPSALQNPVEVLPGLPSMGGLTAYNASDPPAGSIAV